MDSSKVTSKANTKTAKPQNPEKKKKIISFGILIIGLIVLATGAVMLVLNIMKSAQAADGDYLVTAGDWVLEGEDGVIWDFTEVGKGTLTTNNHTNDYDFIWALEDGKLKVETDWLYDLENEYEYSLDQGSKTLTLTADGETYKFKAETK
ncbi:hypothetical protein IKE80_00470 [Candidatus Saccharibacteria bacterium]|nr:hypothetical protein [Candidatus Saccharibacteria bacterium]MBR3177612.1 hypothetical protein [Candidatus Saccharibacteria bacterium]